MAVAGCLRLSQQGWADLWLCLEGLEPGSTYFTFRRQFPLLFLFLFLWLVKLRVPRWSRPMSLSSAYGISAWDRYCVSASARQSQTGSEGSLFSCSCHTALCHCSVQELNLTILLSGRHKPGSWHRAAKAVMFFQCGFSFLYSPPTLGLSALPMATCPAKREQDLLWFLWGLEPANVL